MDTATPGWRTMSKSAFVARVLELIPYANGDKPLPILSRTQEDYFWRMIDAAQEYEVGPYDTACEIVDSYREH